MRTGRRPMFFALTAVICLILAPGAPAEFRWVNYVTAGLAVFWSLMLWIEVLTGRGRGERSAGI
jgi:hypothetical protein